jgi:hypothetical protein
VTVKVLHLRDGDNGVGSAIALHPQVTVVRGLDDQRRAWLVNALAELPAGRAGAEGEIDAHGLRFPIDQASLTLLGLASATPAVVRAADLPGHDATAASDLAELHRAEREVQRLTEELTGHRGALAAALTAREAGASEISALERGEGAARDVVASAEAARARRQAEVDSARQERERHEQALVQAVLARDVAVEARETAEVRVEQSRDAHRSAMTAASGAAAAIEEARSVAADDPTDALADARRHLVQAEAAVDDADPEGDGSPVRRRVLALEARRAELLRMREALGSDQGAPLARALDRLSGASSEAQPVVAALALADTWRDLHQQLRALDAGVDATEVRAEERVALARRTMLEAESDFNQPVLTPEQIAKVEAAHAAVLEAQDRTEARFGGGRARKKLDDTRLEERRVLERLGFSTYADYMMSSSSRGMGSANRSILDTARTQLKVAEAELAALPGAADRARRRSELVQRRDAVAPRVADLLGHPPTGPEAEEELRHLREPVAPNEAALADLAVALSDSGVALGPEPHDPDDLVLLARSYLAEQEATSARRNDVAAALAALDESIETLRAAQGNGATELPELAALPPMAEPIAPDVDGDVAAQDVARREARWAELETTRRSVTDLEAAVVRHREATDRIATLEAELAASGSAVDQATAAVTSSESDLELANGSALDDAIATVAETESALARARAREEELAQAAQDGGGTSEVDSLLHDARARQGEADAAVTEAAAAEQRSATSLAQVEAARQAADQRIQERESGSAAVDRAKLVDDIEWELMSRLASVRSVGVAGSVPLVLDDPFSVLQDDEVARVLDKVGQLAGAVQLVVVSDRPAVARWASDAGPLRAATV